MRNYPIRLSKRERAELERRAKSRAGRADDARIARVLLLLAEGVTYREIAGRVDCSEPFISKWKKRFVAERLAGLYVRHEGRPVTVLTPKVEARILNWTRKKPTDGSTHWSTRRLAKKLGYNYEKVRDIAENLGARLARMARIGEVDTNASGRFTRDKDPYHPDNLSAHKTQRVQEFLDTHPNVTLHFTPTYSSWSTWSRSIATRSLATTRACRT